MKTGEIKGNQAAELENIFEKYKEDMELGSFGGL